MRNAKTSFLSLLMILGSTLTVSCYPSGNDPVFGGIPLLTTTDGALTSSQLDVLPFEAFVVGYDNARMNPAWVCYRAFRNATTSSGSSSSWKTDDRTTAAVSNNDYKYTDYDRGHMAPKAIIYRCYGSDAVRETHIMTNAAPQMHAFNDGPWGDLEDLVRETYARDLWEVWVVAGPIFDDSNGQAFLTKDAEHANDPQKPVEIPDGFYKILIDIEDGKIRTLAFIMDAALGYSYATGDTPQDKLDIFLTSIDEIEAQMGLDFFWMLEDGAEDVLDAAVAAELW